MTDKYATMYCSECGKPTKILELTLLVCYSCAEGFGLNRAVQDRVITDFQPGTKRVNLS